MTHYTPSTSPEMPTNKSPNNTTERGNMPLLFSNDGSRPRRVAHSNEEEEYCVPLASSDEDDKLVMDMAKKGWSIHQPLLARNAKDPRRYRSARYIEEDNPFSEWCETRIMARPCKTQLPREHSTTTLPRIHKTRNYHFQQLVQQDEDSGSLKNVARLLSMASDICIEDSRTDRPSSATLAFPMLPSSPTAVHESSIFELLDSMETDDDNLFQELDNLNLPTTTLSGDEKVDQDDNNIWNQTNSRKRSTLSSHSSNRPYKK